MVMENLTLFSMSEKDNVKSLIELYQELYRYHFGQLPKLTTYAQTYVMFRNLLGKYTLAQCACLIMLHFEWRGLTGDSESTFDFLMSAGFPIALLIKNAPKYETYLMGNEPTSSLWRNEDELTQYIDSLYTELMENNADLPL